MSEVSRMSDIGPYGIVPLWVVQAVDGTAVRVFALLAAKYADRSGHAWPSQRTIARDLGLSEKTVRRALDDLRAAEAVEAAPRYRRDGGRSSNDYRLRFGHPPVVDDRPPPVVDDRPPRSSATGDELDLVNQTTTPYGVTAARRPPTPPKVKLDGRANLVMDALIATTNSDPRLEGGKLASAAKTIRLVVFDDLVAEVDRQAAGNPAAEAALDRLHAEGSLDFERRVADLIRQRAVAYRERWPNVELTPTALARHWSRVTTPRPGGALSATEILNLDPREL